MPCLSDAAIRAASHQGDIGSGVLEGDELAAAGQRDRLVEGAGPAHAAAAHTKSATLTRVYSGFRGLLNRRGTVAPIVT
jgi:hypothetical protein